MNRPSIRKRLILWTTVLFSLLLIVADFLLYSTFRSSLYDQMDRFLDDAASVVLIEVEVKNNAVYHEWQEALEADPHRSKETLIQVWDQKTGESARSPALGKANLEKRSGALNERVFFDLELPDGSPGRAVGILIHPTLEHPERDPDFIPADHPQIFVWAGNITHLQSLLKTTRNSFIFGVSLVVLLLWGIVSWVTKFSLTPMQEINLAMKERSGTEIGNPVPIPDDLPGEIVEMADSFNSLLSRIDESRQKDRDFFLNIAHEIRTPLAGIYSLAEQALRNPRSAEDYRGRLVQILSGSEDLRNLVSRLLKFGRINRGNEEVELSPIDLGSLIKEIQKPLQDAASERSLSFQNSFPASPLIIKSDVDLLRIVISNILENATSYARAESQILTSLAHHDKGVELTFENPVSAALPDAAELERFFDPFYRQDKVRSRQAGHVGLGLSFCRDIMKTLGGSISAERREPESIIFRVHLPASCLITDSFEI